jgi:hypothetical protein
MSDDKQNEDPGKAENAMVSWLREKVPLVDTLFNLREIRRISRGGSKSASQSSIEADAESQKKNSTSGASGNSQSATVSTVGMGTQRGSEANTSERPAQQSEEQKGWKKVQSNKTSGPVVIGNRAPKADIPGEKPAPTVEVPQSPVIKAKSQSEPVPEKVTARSVDAAGRKLSPRAMEIRAANVGKKPPESLAKSLEERMAKFKQRQPEVENTAQKTKAPTTTSATEGKENRSSQNQAATKAQGWTNKDAPKVLPPRPPIPAHMRKAGKNTGDAKVVEPIQPSNKASKR